MERTMMLIIDVLDLASKSMQPEEADDRRWMDYHLCPSHMMWMIPQRGKSSPLSSEKRLMVDR